MCAGYHLTLLGNYIKPHTPFYKYMNKIITEDYYEGAGCTCEARSSYECGCENADWTPKEVYDLRGEVVDLKGFAESTANLAKSLKAERDEAREAFVIATDQMVIAQGKVREANKERDEAREALMKIEDLFIDGTNVYADREKMGTIARNELEKVEQERDEAREDRKNSRQSLGFALEELNEVLNEAKDNLVDEIKFHDRTDSELVNANCRMLDMQNDNSQLADRLTALELHSTSELARLEQELADAREEAHRFRSLYYAKSGINKSASAFPWEDAK